MISVDQALAIVLDNVASLGVETVALENACGRVLGEDIIADIDLPPFDRARMDGYALRASDSGTTPARLLLIGETAAGQSFDGLVGEGQAVKIFTGAPVPAGADAVQKVEVTRQTGDWVEILEPVAPAQFITARASEARAGDKIARAGRPVAAAEMAALASFGYSRVKVGRRPRVAAISTGSELVAVSDRPAGAEIRNSNAYSIAAYSQNAGGAVEIVGTVKDSLDETREALVRAAASSDVVITSGGVSMGDYDLVKAALRDIGAEIFFDKVVIRPGKPIVFARLGATFFFGLPGNPVSTSVTFNVFVRPALRRMQGDASPVLPTARVRVSRPLKDSSSRRSYLPARLTIEEGQAVAEPLKWGGSSDLVAFINADALIIVPEQTHEIAEGELAEALLLGTVLR
ncbi:MAG TPA: gephyrin-like molybdotransferase Glp [Blastocatellia bacterium]|jgi:molybdenum cofactor synthesis domain-containing protein